MFLSSYQALEDCCNSNIKSSIKGIADMISSYIIGETELYEFIKERNQVFDFRYVNPYMIDVYKFLGMVSFSKDQYNTGAYLF